MKSYTKVVNVSEQQLEHLVMRNPGLIEDGLVYVDHQRPAAGGRLDVLMVDSGKALVVAELKAIQDDGMLVQGLDYYDYVSDHAEAFARLYKTHAIDPMQEVRLFLIAPDFSQTLVNRCKWFDLPISLFTFTCLKFEGEADLQPVFTEREIPTPVEIVEPRPQIADNLAHITDESVRAGADAFLAEIKSWNPEHVSVDSTKSGISMKAKNRVFANLWPRRRHYILGTYSTDDEWQEYPIKGNEDLAKVKPTVKAAMEKRMR